MLKVAVIADEPPSSLREPEFVDQSDELDLALSTVERHEVGDRYPYIWQQAARQRRPAEAASGWKARHKSAARRPRA